MSLPCFKLSSPLFAAEPAEGGGKFDCFGATPAAPRAAQLVSPTPGSAIAATRGVQALVPSSEGHWGSTAPVTLRGDTGPSHPRGAAGREPALGWPGRDRGRAAGMAAGLLLPSASSAKPEPDPC